MMEKILVVRIGQMKYYQGFQREDSEIIGGGSFLEKAEINNFRTDDSGILWGYFTGPGKSENNRRKCDLTRIDPSFDPDSPKYNDQDGYNCVKGVLVVFVHTVKGHGPVIAGWYRNATVYEELRDGEYQGIEYLYHAEAEEKNCVLIPIEERPRNIVKYARPGKKGGIGQTGVFYVLDDKGRDKKERWIGKTLDYTKEYKGRNLLKPRQMEQYLQEKAATTEESIYVRSGGQGRQMDPALRREIEMYAMERAKNYFRKHYSHVKDTSANNPYDFLCSDRKGRRSKQFPDKLMVEVKGTQQGGKSVELTIGEVKNAQKKGNSVALFIVHSIQLDKKKKPFGGRTKILNPWNIDRDGTKKPTQFTYTLKK